MREASEWRARPATNIVVIVIIIVVTPREDCFQSNPLDLRRDRHPRNLKDIPLSHFLEALPGQEGREKTTRRDRGRGGRGIFIPVIASTTAYRLLKFSAQGHAFPQPPSSPPRIWDEKRIMREKTYMWYPRVRSLANWKGNWTGRREWSIDRDEKTYTIHDNCINDLCKSLKRLLEDVESR